MNKQPKRIALTVLALSVSLALAGVANAQDTGNADAQKSAAQSDADQTQQSEKPTELSTIIVTGTRLENRTESASLTPVDVVPIEVLQQSGSIDLAKALDHSIPSLNYSYAPVSDTFAFQRPFELRGLNSNQVLVLVNGQRWHAGAIMLTLGQVGQGSRGVDLNTIPMSAIDHVEVLRDGASAQYGSDAIAGVVNIILKSGAKGGGAQLNGGEYSAGDGQQWSALGNFGVPLGGDKGWLRLSIKASNQNPTDRGGLDNRPGYTKLGKKFHFGVAKFEGKNLFLNTQYNLTSNVHLYAFGHWGRRVGEPPAFYRYGTNAPSPKSPIMAEIFPNGDGFLPLEHGISIDKSLVVGLRGEVGDGWRWDISGNYGSNEVNYNTWNSINFAYYDDFGYSPRDMHDGILTSTQSTFDIDISKELGSDWTLSFGAQYLRQGYRVQAGEEASYYTSLTSPETGGAQGFAGWGPQDAFDVSRHDVAEYVQLEGNLTERLSTSIAARHEDYSDFGTTTSGALSARFDFSPEFAMRGTVSTGFRAPGLGQQHYSQTSSTSFPEGNALGLPEGIYLRGIVPVDNKLARLLGSEPLEAEKSRSITGGIVWTPTPAFTTTIDLYQINVKNIIQLSSSISMSSDTVRDYLADNGIANPEFVALNYFTNAGELRTRGIGWVSTYIKHFDGGGNLRSTLSWAYHKNKVLNVRPNPPELDALGDIGFHRLTRDQTKGLLADLMPRSKVIFTNTYTRGHWGFTGTATMYGRVTDFSSTDYTDDLIYPHKWLFDAAVHYYQDRWTFSIGSNNIFNTYPRLTPDGDNFHGIFRYSSNSPFGFQGAYWYGKVSYRW